MFSYHHLMMMMILVIFAVTAVEAEFRPKNYDFNCDLVIDTDNRPRFLTSATDDDGEKRSLRQKRDLTKDYGVNVTRALLHITGKGGYDNYIRPNYKGSPVVVNLTMFIMDVSHISETTMDVTLDFYFRQLWHDPRLDFSDVWDEEIVVLGGEVVREIWRPDTFFVNAKHSVFHHVTALNTFLRISPIGNVSHSLRLTVVASCPMDFTYFPMDSQRCSIQIESYGYTKKDIAYQWANKNDKSVSFAPQMSTLPQFQIRGHREVEREERLSTGVYSRLAVDIYFKRDVGYYLIQVYVPSALIVVLSLISFWINRESAPARVSLGITTVLTMTTLISSTNANLPRISYLKALDVYLVCCFIMVFAALLEYAAVTYTAKRCKMAKENCCLICQRLNAKASSIEIYSRIIFPTIFLCFNVVYWIVYLNLSIVTDDEGFIPV